MITKELFEHFSDIGYNPSRRGPAVPGGGPPGESRDGTERQSLQAAAGLEREVDGSRSMVWEFQVDIWFFMGNPTRL